MDARLVPRGHFGRCAGVVRRQLPYAELRGQRRRRKRCAEQIGQQAETFRRDLAVLWLGKPLPNWAQPCPITAQVAENLGCRRARRASCSIMAKSSAGP